MQSFSTWSERQAHLVRWILLVGWLLLIASLLLNLDPYPFDVNRCGGSPDCHSHEGNQIFWGMVVPAGILILVVLSHEVWRRICPLAFASQLFRALGWQRTETGRGGRREVARISAGSWLGRHHVRLQWGLLIAGLCLRLLVVNASTLGLGLFLLTTLAAAIAVGWAWDGKAWCQYFCPMAPVQTILTGPRSLLGSPAHLETSSRITQSMCRSIGENGRVQSACVACQTPCLDIDSERTYWQTLSGKRGLNAAWWSYPGLVVAFFLLIKVESRAGLDYLRSGMWAYDRLCAHLLLSPLGSGHWILGIPRVVSIPALLLLGGGASFLAFRGCQGWLQGQLEAELGERAADAATSRTRHLATFVAVNGFFWFADPTLGMLGPAGGQGIRSLVLIVSGMWLYRGWPRERSTYTRESTSGSLRKQIERLIPDLSPYLDGRSLRELSPGEVFTLARVLPKQISETKRSIYKGVMADLLGSGRLDRAASLVQLEELRRSLDLVEEDHFATVRELAIEDPRLLQLDARQQESRTLRQEAAAEAIEELMTVALTPDLNVLLGQPHLRGRLEEIRRDFGLDEASWEELMRDFGPDSPYAHRRLEAELELLRSQLACRRCLELAGEGEPLLRPLLPVMDRRLTSHVLAIAPAMRSFPEDARLAETLETLQALFPAPLRVQLHRREQSLPAAADTPSPAALGPLPEAADVLDQLWLDPDPDTALWALWVQLRRSAERGEALRRRPRVGLPSSDALQRLLRGEGLEEADLMERLLAVPLVAGLAPSDLFRLVRWGERRTWRPGEVLFRIGDPHGFVAILLEGSCDVWQEAEGDGGGGEGGRAEPIARVLAGEPIGEVSFFSNQPRQVRLQAGSEPVQALVFTTAHFELLLQQSAEFSRRLLHELALKVESLYARLGRGATAGGSRGAP